MFPRQTNSTFMAFRWTSVECCLFGGLDGMAPIPGHPLRLEGTCVTMRTVPAEQPL
jgi:hypothetical protein